MQTVRDVTSILDQWCSKKDNLVRTQFGVKKKQREFLDDACFTRGIDRIVNEMRLVSREQKSLIDKKLKEIDDLGKKWGNVPSKETREYISRSIKSMKKSLSFLTNARKETYKQRVAVENDIKNLTFDGGDLTDFFKMQSINRDRINDLEKVVCPERTKNQLILTCKREGKRGCSTLNKKELIEFLC